MRFGTEMQQTFADLLRERSGKPGAELHLYALGIFTETFTSIVGENMRTVTSKATTKRFTPYRLALILAFAPALLLLWLVGALADGGDAPGLFFFGALAVLLVGTLAVRLRPRGMAWVLYATAFTQVVIAAFAMAAWGQYLELSILNGVFVVLWLGAAMLFRRTGEYGPPFGEEQILSEVSAHPQQ